MTATTFYDFLITYRSPSALGDPISDLGMDLAVDMEAPKADAALYAYLKEKIESRFEEVVDDAWLEYLKVRS